MESGTVILIERMKTHPEEFLDEVFIGNGKWHRVLDMANSCLPEEDKRAIKQAQDRMYIDEFNGLVLRTLAGEVEPEERTLTIKSKERYTTSWSDPRQMALAEQARKNSTITTTPPANITGAVITGANVTSTSNILLQPSAFGAVPVSTYSSGES
jgi:hypothetical protein